MGAIFSLARENWSFSFVGVLVGNDDLRVSFVFCNWHTEPDGGHKLQFDKRRDFPSNRRIHREIGSSIFPIGGEKSNDKKA